MSELKINDNAPKFILPTDSNGSVNLNNLKGKNVVLYFYPKDDTPGCTMEAKDFTENYAQFEDKNTVIIGISKDTPAKHDKFKDKYSLPFTLASDEGTKICQEYGTWIEKSMYGRKYMGIERSTFVIDPDGILIKEWRGVKVPGHVEEVYNFICEL